MEKKAILICFSVKSEKFGSNYERNKFFRGLYGWKQIINREEKKYVYERGGLLDEMPHKKIDQSSFIVDMDDFERVMNFFEEWGKKVIWNKFKVLLDEDEFEEIFEDV